MSVASDGYLPRATFTSVNSYLILQWMDKKMNYLSGVLDTAGVCMKFTATSYKKHVSGELEQSENKVFT